MANHETMKELMLLIEKFEEKSGRDCICVEVFSDGSGHVKEYGVEVFSFDNEINLIAWLQS